MPERTTDETQNVKRRRLQGACDICRKKKVRCDSAEMPGNRCTNCITFKTECTHARAKGPDVNSSTLSSDPITEVSKTAQEHVSTVLSTSTVYIPSNDPSVMHQVLVEVSKYARDLEEKLAALQPQTPVPPIVSPNPDSPAGAPEAEPSPAAADSSVDDDINDPLKGVTPFGAPLSSRFFGKSSSMQFVRAAIQHVDGNNSYLVGTRRPEFWFRQPWEKFNYEAPAQFFPDSDLMEALIQIYFDQINPLLDILHYPSFSDSVADGQHFRDRDFGAVVLAICALASRYSDDPRVFEGASEHSCGWKWFRQIRPLRATFSPEPSLYHLQTISLSILFLAGSSNPEETWILAGLGIRFAQGAGAHNRTGYARMKPLEAELYKRVFWVLVTTDTIMSSFKGRPRITHKEDFDIDLPLDCDDEYWHLLNPVQPVGKPSPGAFLSIYMRLIDIFGRIQRAIYPLNGQICNPDVVAELDSALNNWVDSIPDHLRWDPHREDLVFLDQSTALYATYYHAQILIHRPFIPAPGRQNVSTISFPSLAICANAARSLGHVMDVQSRRSRGLLHHPHVMSALFDSAVVLLLNVWGSRSRKYRTSSDFDRATADAQNCVRVLRLYERRWRVAGRKCDIISAMLSLGKYTANGPSLKRSRDVDPESPSHDSTLFGERPPAPPGSNVLTIAQQIQELELSIQQTDNLFSLPLHTDELGRLPVYDSFDYNFNFPPADTQQQQYQTTAQVYSDAMSFSPPEFVTPVPNGGYQRQTDLAPVDGHIDMRQPLEIPSGSNWQDWSIYLSTLDGLNYRGEGAASY
ncbi:fungal-specific transcription factor domain-containing protein [Mycena rebaudengoi]|nr:fungal-specific transcription factor domain-containing protein [Mycena rebaudengoi]